MLTLTTSCTAVTWTTSGRHVSTSGSSTSFPGSTAGSLVKSKMCKTYVCNYIIVFFLICVYFHITQSENQVVFVETRISFSKAGNTVQSRKSQLTIRTTLGCRSSLQWMIPSIYTYRECTTALNDYLLTSPVVSTLLLFQPSSVSEHSLEHLLVQDLYKFSPRI